MTPGKRAEGRGEAASKKERVTSAASEGVKELEPSAFRGLLMGWYATHARKLPWRSTSDPYEIWVSEIMLQQTRVAAVVEHYTEFLRRFPTLVALSLAEEEHVLAAWSGLGYYRRARMLHKAARFLVQEREGRFPENSAELRTLPGIGDYTAAAIASIAFGESVAVVDGNVERVILRLMGRPDEASAEARAFVRAKAQGLMQTGSAVTEIVTPAMRRQKRGWDAEERIALAASAHPNERAGGDNSRTRAGKSPAGEQNQAMMELGATICLPKSPLCLQCPVRDFCRTRGEHVTLAGSPQRSQPAAYLLDLRKRGPATEVLLERRSDESSLMPGMYELPPLPMDAVEGREPVLRVRHSITNTNYYVQVFAPQRLKKSGEAAMPTKGSLRRAVPIDSRDLCWVPVKRLPGVPITGLARKILRRLHVIENARISLLE